MKIDIVYKRVEKIVKALNKDWDSETFGGSYQFIDEVVDGEQMLPVIITPPLDYLEAVWIGHALGQAHIQHFSVYEKGETKDARVPVGGLFIVIDEGIEDDPLVEAANGQ